MNAVEKLPTIAQLQEINKDIADKVLTEIQWPSQEGHECEIRCCNVIAMRTSDIGFDSLCCFLISPLNMTLQTSSIMNKKKSKCTKNFVYPR